MRRFFSTESLCLVVAYVLVAAGVLKGLGRLDQLGMGLAGLVGIVLVPLLTPMAQDWWIDRLVDLGRLDAAADKIEWLLRGVSSPRLRNGLLIQLSMVLLDGGRLEDAERALDGVRRSALQPLERAAELAVRAHVLALQGQDLERAMEMTDQALAELQHGDIHVTRGLVLLASGQPVAAVAEIERAQAMDSRPSRRDLAGRLYWLGEAQAARGDQAAARDSYRKAASQGRGPYAARAGEKIAASTEMDDR